MGCLVAGQPRSLVVAGGGRNVLHFPPGDLDLRFCGTQKHPTVHSLGQSAALCRPDLVGGALVWRQCEPCPVFRTGTGRLDLARLVGLLDRSLPGRRTGGGDSPIPPLSASPPARSALMPLRPSWGNR